MLLLVSRLDRVNRAALVVVVILSAVAGRAARGQDPAHEYRPQIVLTSPRWHGVAIAVLEEQHLHAADLGPAERQHGVTLLPPGTILGAGSVELRQIVSGAGLVERRYIPTLTQSLPLAPRSELRNRIRAEFRDVAGTWSRRYQDRVTVLRTLTVDGHDLQPYAHAALSYDSRYSALTRREGALGIRIPLVNGASLDPFLLRQTDSRRTIPTIVATGLTMRVVL